MKYPSTWPDSHTCTSITHIILRNNMQHRIKNRFSDHGTLFSIVLWKSPNSIQILNVLAISKKITTQKCIFIWPFGSTTVPVAHWMVLWGPLVGTGPLVDNETHLLKYNTMIMLFFTRSLMALCFYSHWIISTIWFESFYLLRYIIIKLSRCSQNQLYFSCPCATVCFFVCFFQVTFQNITV